MYRQCQAFVYTYMQAMHVSQWCTRNKNPCACPFHKCTGWSIINCRIKCQAVRSILQLRRCCCHDVQNKKFLTKENVMSRENGVLYYFISTKVICYYRIYQQQNISQIIKHVYYTNRNDMCCSLSGNWGWQCPQNGTLQRCIRSLF